jgi:DNA processing protein
MQKDYNYHKLNTSEVPERLTRIDSPPKQLFYIGTKPHDLLIKPTVSIVGSRKPTPYGREVTAQLTRELTKQEIVIVSGLALGVDSIAHQTCLEAGGTTIAVLPCGPESVYPRSHLPIARRIVEQGGSLITEYPVGTQPLRQNFIARNRIVSALGDVVIITEAAEKSGTLHTANFALNQGKTVMAVPGPVTSSLSKGTNNLIKTGALPLTDTSDVLFQLGIDQHHSKQEIIASTPEEHMVLTLLQQGVTDGNQLLSISKLQPPIFNQTLTMLEINGKVKAVGNNHWQII